MAGVAHNLMNDSHLGEGIGRQLQELIARALPAGNLLTEARVQEQTSAFADRFGPDVLRRLDGAALLKTMHGRSDPSFRCLAYWLEFKDDDEFAGHRFGSISGGSALKFGIYQRQSDGAWITGSAGNQRVLTVAQAIEIAEGQLKELRLGSEVLARLDPADTSDEAYFALQQSMSASAPNLSDAAWAHKYWFLLFPDRLDDYHSPKWQRFHLLKLLQMPPDGRGILDSNAPRFVCAGRYVSMARSLEVATTSLLSVLNERHGTFHRYWRIGTTAGDSGESQWPQMRAGNFVSIGWADALGDLTEVLGTDLAIAKAEIRARLSDEMENPATATRKAGEVLNFCRIAAENDVVLACEGQTVLGVGRIRGPYQYDESLDFPHLRSVAWLDLEPWKLPKQEGLLTTVSELGKHAENILALERRLFENAATGHALRDTYRVAGPALSLPPLDPFSARIEGMLARKGQVVLYGPPGTGKTYQALNAAGELAGRKLFGKNLAALTKIERSQLYGAEQYIRTCTFHPGYGYEDFIEGLRPKTSHSGQLVFEPKDGLFKKICDDAARHREMSFFLIIDEINRGDIPRIFGELMTALELDKRTQGVILPITGKVLSIPQNLFVIGTMNTSDRSISLMDTALRRRFAFAELMPDSAVLGTRAVGPLLLGPWLDALNARIRKHLKRDARNLQVGHSFLLPPQKVSSPADFVRVLREEIIPLLEEYCYDDFDSLRNILGTELVDIDRQCIREALFEPQREADLIAAVTFEEVQGLALAKSLPSTEEAASATDEDAEDPDDFAER